MSLPSSRPLSSSPDPGRGRSPSVPRSRDASNARLASPLPTGQRAPNGGSLRSPPLGPSADTASSSRLAIPDARARGSGRSALSAALRASPSQVQASSSSPSSLARDANPAKKRKLSVNASVVGSFENRSVQGSYKQAKPHDDETVENVKRHLLGPRINSSPVQSAIADDEETPPPLLLQDDIPSSLGLGPGGPLADHEPDNPFDSLKSQGGDTTRPIYRWVEAAESNAPNRTQRSQSFHISRPMDEDGADIDSIKAPGGFRREYVRRLAQDQESTRSHSQAAPADGTMQRGPITRNFLEFLSLYGHFAGERLDDDESSIEPTKDYESEPCEPMAGSLTMDGSAGDDREPGEESGLLGSRQFESRRKSKTRKHSGTGSARSASLLLMKSFIGTGVLFLPRAFANGGMIFSNIVLLVVAVLCYYCFILLVKTNLKISGSFGRMGQVLYGGWMQWSILTSVVISQIGFSAAYMVFVAENLKQFLATVSDCKTIVSIPVLIVGQLALFLPLSLVRDINKLSATALAADVLILLGLLYLYYFDIYTIAKNHGVSDIVSFNSKGWTIFIGTAIFAFEGIGLILPIQEGMKNPSQFPPVLAGVMAIVVLVTLTMGAFSYAAFGSHTQTVVLLNLPPKSKMSSAVQFMYSVAILLSTPLQIFPAIKITENSVFSRSGKFSRALKWQKNMFRFCMTALITAIAWGGADDLDKFVSLVGSFACIPLVLIYPPLLHSRAVATGRLSHMVNASLIVLGLITMVYTTGLTMASWGEHPHKKPDHCASKGV